MIEPFLQALKSLARVERTTWNAKQHGKMPRDLATFLKPHILGIMTYLNEVLQDVQGRRSPEYKKQVVRSIGELIKKIGSPISAIAPQVRLKFWSPPPTPVLR